MTRWQSIAIVTLVAAIVMLTNLGGPRLWDRDEPRNAGCAWEMMARGDWVVPVFNGELRTHKPVLLYWLIMAAYGLFGTTEFAARLPSALLAIGTAVCTCELGRHLFSPRAGTWAGIAVTTSLMFVVAGRAATPDSTLMFFSTLAITLFAAVTAEPDGHQHRLSWLRAVGIYGAMGCAALAKGPVGILLPAATIGLFQLVAAPHAVARTACGWRARCLNAVSKLAPLRVVSVVWSLRPFTALFVILAIAAPWYVWVGLRTDGEFLRGFFLEHNLRRATDTMEGHRGNLFFYPLTMLVGMFPWSVFAGPLTIDLWRRTRGNHVPKKTGYILAGCWLAVYLGVFSVAKTKLPSYITPSYPAAAIVLGAFLDGWLAGRIFVSRAWLQTACVVLSLVGLVIVIAIPWVVRDQLPGETGLGILGLVPLAAGIFAWWAIRREQPKRALWCLGGGATAFATLLFAVGAARVDRHQLNHRLLHTIDELSTHPRVAAFGCLEPSWVFYGRRPIDEISSGTVGPTHPPYVERNDRWVAKPKVTTADLIASGEDVLIITTGRELDAARKQLPEDYQVIEIVPLFLKRDNLFLLGRGKGTIIASRDRVVKAK